jgi:hypothetical protein
MLTDQLELFGTTHHHHSTMLIVDKILPPRASTVVPPIPHTQLKVTPEFKLAARPFRNTDRFSSLYPKRVSPEHFPSLELTPSDSSDSISLVSDSGSSTLNLSEDSKIPKPPGEPGRLGHGGYTLYNALDWSPKSYAKFKVSVMFSLWYGLYSINAFRNLFTMSSRIISIP